MSSQPIVGQSCPHYGNALCYSCHIHALDEARDHWTATVEEKVERRVTFLSLRVDNENEVGVLKPDCAILVNDVALHAHKFVLASRSPVFCKMFDNKMLENETGFVRIDDATLPVMRAVVDFCYNAVINFTDEVNSCDVMEVAHKYSIDFLVKICEEHLIQTLDNNNLARRLKLAMKYQNKTLAAGALDYFKTNYEDTVAGVIDYLF